MPRSPPASRQRLLNLPPLDLGRSPAPSRRPGCPTDRAVHGSADDPPAAYRRETQVTRQQTSPSARITARSIAVLQLADVAGPGVCRPACQALPATASMLLADIPAHALDEVMREHRDVVARGRAAAARDRKHRQPEVEILAELARRHRLPQVAVGRGDNANVDLDRRACRRAARTLGFERAQDLGLHDQRHLADLVEEEGAAVRHLELARACAGRAGEGAASRSRTAPPRAASREWPRS